MDGTEGGRVGGGRVDREREECGWNGGRKGGTKRGRERERM